MRVEFCVLRSATKDVSLPPPQIRVSYSLAILKLMILKLTELPAAAFQVMQHTPSLDVPRADFLDWLTSKAQGSYFRIPSIEITSALLPSLCGLLPHYVGSRDKRWSLILLQ